MEVNVITLENGHDYMIVDAIEINNDKYLFLANEDNDIDMCIRKVILKDGKDYLIKLDNDEEFDEVMTAFNNKHLGKGEDNEK